MKSFLVSLLIALSAGLNILLLVGLASPATVAPVVALVRPGKSSGTSLAGGFSKTAVAGGRLTGSATAAAAAADWASMNTDDLPSLVASLRAAGFSDAVIRGILQSKLQEKVTARRRELTGPVEEIPYWKNATTSAATRLMANPQAQAELREMNKANAKAINDLLGPDPDAAIGLSAMNDRLQFGDLPADRIEMLKAINTDYGELQNAVSIGANGILLPGDREKMAYLTSEKDKDLRDLLSPKEYDDYQLRTSNTANSLRSNLVAFDPTESEFMTIYNLQRPFDLKYNTNLLGGMTADLAAERAAAQKQLTEDIKAALPPDRVADYERTTDSSYRQASALVDKLGLPRSSATDVWSLQKDIQNQATAIRSDRTLTADARTEKLTALQQEATNKASAVLGGSHGLDTYKINGGQWIQSLVPTAATAGVPNVITTGGAATIISTGNGGYMIIGF